MKTFNQYLQVQQDFRFGHSGEIGPWIRQVRVRSLAQLLKAGKERFPDWYRNQIIFQSGNGKQTLERLWAKYLASRDGTVF